MSYPLCLSVFANHTGLFTAPRCQALCSRPLYLLWTVLHGMEEVLFKRFLAQSVVFQESMLPSVVFTPMALNRLSRDLLCLRIQCFFSMLYVIFSIPESQPDMVGILFTPYPP